MSLYHEHSRELQDRFAEVPESALPLDCVEQGPLRRLVLHSLDEVLDLLVGLLGGHGRHREVRLPQARLNLLQARAGLIRGLGKDESP